MNNDEITYKVPYKKEMTMKELVDAINNRNESMMMGFNAMLQNQTDLLLKKMDERFDEVNKRMDERFGSIQKTLDTINSRLDNVDNRLNRIENS
jgi:uncharacterized protein YllA (UPF0747 family)